jgi:ATP-binding cassette subfamily F protein 3
VSRREARRAEAEQRQRESAARRPFEERIAAIEAELEALRGEDGQAEAWLSRSEAYEAAHRERLQELLRRRGEIQARIARLEDDWLWAHAEMERRVAAARGAAG